MNSGITPKSVAVVFVAAMILYFGGFYGVEYLRARKGPWEVGFEANSGAAPAIVINQPAVGIAGTKLVFHGETTTNQSGTVRFDAVEKNALFGELVYEDLTFLPGVITFNFFGHEIELVPRVLVINKREVPWQSGAVIDLWPTNKLPLTLKTPKGNRPAVNR